MSDRVFFPLAFVCAIALIWVAMVLRPSGQDPVVTETAFLMEGPALSQLVAGPGTSALFDPDASQGAISRLSAMASLDSGGGLSAGVGAVLPADFEARLPGQTIEVTVGFNAADSDLSKIGLAYFTVGSGDTGWQLMPVTSDGGVLSFRHAVPDDAPLGNNDWVGIWPDPEGSGRWISVNRIEVRILPDSAAS